MSIATELDKLKTRRDSIVSAINDKGGTCASGVSLAECATAIGTISSGDTEAYEPCTLPTTAITLQMKSGTLNVAVNDHIKILDADFKSWTIEEWHAKAVENGFDKTLRAEPIGFDIKVWGKHFYWYFKTKYRDTSDAKTYYDVSGSKAQTDGKLRHSQWQHPLITGAYSKTDANNTTATAVVDGDNIILSTTNSPLTWTIAKNCGAASSLLTDNVSDRFNALIAQTEWFRHRAAIDSGLTTTEADGTIGTVTIVTEDDGEMYFYVNGTKTDCLAKYNYHQMMIYDNPTTTIIDAIYEAQKTNGTNMNASCENGDDKPVVTEGSKGAEAYAYNGKWMIATPVLTRCSTNLNMDYNIPDAPAIYYVNWLNEQYSNRQEPIIMPNERMLQAYWTNKNYAISSYINYLNNANGECWGTTVVPSAIDTDSWSVVRYGAVSSWYVSMHNGGMSYGYVYSRYVGVGVSALS